MELDYSLPAADLAEVRIIAASPEAARRVAEVLRSAFDGGEQRSYPAGADDTGTRLNLTVDTTRHPVRNPRDTGLRPALGRTVTSAEPHSDEVHVNLADR